MDDLRDLAKPDNSDVDLLHWPSPHCPCHFQPARSILNAGMTHAPYRLAPHLHSATYAAAGRLVNIPES
jgi:hypothetical protein